jgi:EAL domain-containing protein (putative c-di-GMP-specific phosphodiesterase class I)
LVLLASRSLNWRWSTRDAAALKIDRSLITGVLRERVSHAIASSIATLGERLGVTVVAEGIETADDLAAAREIGCHRGQGYFIGHPTAPELLLGDG